MADAALALGAVLVGIWVVRLALMRARARDYVMPAAPVAVVALWKAAAAGGEAASFLAFYLQSGAVIGAVLTLVWLASLARRDSSIMDIAYAAVVGVAAWVAALRDASFTPQAVVALVLVTLWSARLSLHLAVRNLPHGEDPRYTRWRQRFGAHWWWWSYFQVFLLQGVLIWLWALPLHLALWVHAEWHPLHAAAGLVFAVGFAFEAGGDWQLARFRADPANRGKVLDAGLWRLTRHPNYFGEAVIWWSFWLLALAHPWGWASVVCPLWVTWFMARDSATPMQERYLAKTKPGYADYVARVPAFVPWTRPG
ncbi:MAG: DUF1295 domain-containing protein [Burkholderiales bacterium]|nr:DUF1295 domain-containing protein [Burkholderiales bacterium]